jgi:tetratricopeptide (TPR) repeat protein
MLSQALWGVSMAQHPVFISYARTTSASQAKALHRELGGDDGLAFLDTSDIETLQKFPAEISDALLAAKVVVVFADETYFTRWYCLREFDLALTPFQKLARSGADSSAKQAALSHIVVALPDAGVEGQVLNSLPADLRITNWPSASDTKKVAEIVKERLAQIDLSIGQRLDAVMQVAEAKALRQRLSEQGAMPQPLSLRGQRLFPASMEQSLGEGFKGRADDLWRLHHALWMMGVGTAALTGAIEAGGGFGKSRLAIEYLHRYGPDHYKGGLFWIDAAAADDELKQEQAFHGILRTIEPATPELKALHDSGQMARDELTRALQQLPNEEPVLFVIDNVPEPEPNARPHPLSTWCPALGHVTVLATSRMRVHLEGGNIRELYIDVLSPEASVALLTYKVEQASALTHEQWLRIAEWVGRLPLALDLLQRAMRAGALSPTELHSMASESRPPTAELDRLTEAISPQLPRGAVRGITEALNASYERLPEEAKTAARLIAQFAPEPIPLALLKALGDEASNPSVRVALVARSFVTPVEPVGSAEGKVEFLGRMHRVLADFLRAKSSDSMGELLRVGRAVNYIMRPAASQDPGQWPLMNACLPHAEHVFRRLPRARSQTEVREIEVAAVCGLYIGLLYRARGARREAREVMEATLELVSQALGSEHPTALTSNDRQSVRAREHSAARTKKPRSRLARKRARVLQSARELEERALDMCKLVLGPEHPGTVASMNNLAETLHELRDLEGARELYQQVFDIRERTFGFDRDEAVVSMNKLAKALRALGDLRRAHKLEERRLHIRARVLGREHPDTSVSAWNLVGALGRLGEIARADRIVNEYLAWLGYCDPESLGANQRQIREKLMQRRR